MTAPGGGGDNGGDGIRGVMKAIDVLEDQRHEYDRDSERHGASGIFQNNLGNDIAGVAAAVNHFFEQFIKIFENDDLEGIVFAAE